MRERRDRSCPRRGVADALGAKLDPPGSDPSKDVSDALKDAAGNHVVQMSAGAMAARLGQSLLTRGRCLGAWCLRR